jgi:hypothetical protein
MYCAKQRHYRDRARDSELHSTDAGQYNTVFSADSIFLLIVCPSSPSDSLSLTSNGHQVHRFVPTSTTLAYRLSTGKIILLDSNKEAESCESSVVLKKSKSWIIHVISRATLYDRFPSSKSIIIFNYPSNVTTTVGLLAFSIYCAGMAADFIVKNKQTRGKINSVLLLACKTKRVLSVEGRAQPTVCSVSYLRCHVIKTRYI